MFSMKNAALKFFNGFILSAIVSSVLYAECIDGKLKYVEHGKEVIVNESYCFDLASKLFISSKPCAKNKTCQSKNLGTVEIKMSEMAGATGSLGAKICEKYNGTSQSLEYLAQDKWISTSRCLFVDGSFIDNASVAQKIRYVD